ncbi:MAG: MFS transporter [Planctomycetia bacterium]
MNVLQRPTGIRFGMIAITTLVAVMLYLDRVCLSILGSSIRKDLDFSEKEFAWLLSSFFWAYALCQIPAGYIGDRYGARVVLAVYLFFWSLCTGLMGLVSGFGVFLALRIGCGMFEAGAYPLANGIVRRWVPISGRGLASGCVAVGGRLGGAIAPWLTNYLTFGTLDGWRRPFIVYGVVGIIGAVVFWIWYRNRPDQHPAINQEEIDLINGKEYIPDTRKPSLPNFRVLVGSYPLWMASVVQVISNFGWVILITVLPSYMEQVFKTDKDTIASYQSMTLAFGMLGMFFGGWYTDKCFRTMGPKWGRALPIAISRFIVGGAYVCCLFLNDAKLAIAMMCVVALATDMGNPGFWAWCQDVGGKHVGSVVGWGNMWGNIGAALGPNVFIAIKNIYPDDPLKGWNTAFALCAVIQIVGVLAALGVDASRQLRLDKHDA